jgi:hypothetical protein
MTARLIRHLPSLMCSSDWWASSCCCCRCAALRWLGGGVAAAAGGSRTPYALSWASLRPVSGDEDETK